MALGQYLHQSAGKASPPRSRSWLSGPRGSAQPQTFTYALTTKPSKTAWLTTPRTQSPDVRERRQRRLRSTGSAAGAIGGFRLNRAQHLARRPVYCELPSAGAGRGKGHRHYGGRNEPSAQRAEP
jgi:hypothetical protein